MSYARLIRQFTAPEIDPRHVEAFMRSEYGTLDHLSRDEFATAVHAGIVAIEQGGTAMAEELARSYGL